jgi:hypothetical protein
MDSNQVYRFDPPDIEMIKLTMRLSPGARIQRLLDTRDVMVGLIRARLRRRYPDLSPRDLNLKVLEEIERVERSHSRPYVVPSDLIK